MSKAYEELTFADDFMFCKILSTNLDLTKELLELLLDIKIRRIGFIETQKAIEITADGRGIRLDVYVEDEKGTVFDIEMQASPEHYVGLRTRYYQGMIDLQLIERGAVFSDLKKSYIIFILLKDPFSENLPVYTFENRCEQKPDLKLGDESVKVIVNADGDRSGLPAKMNSFLDYLKEGLAKDSFTRKLDAAVETARRHEEWRVEYMTLLMRDQMMKEEGRKEGRAEGRKEGRKEGRAEGFDLYDRLYSYIEENPDEALESVSQKFDCALDAVQKIHARVHGKRTWKNA